MNTNSRKRSATIKDRNRAALRATIDKFVAEARPALTLREWCLQARISYNSGAALLQTEDTFDRDVTEGRIVIPSAGPMPKVFRHKFPNADRASERGTGKRVTIEMFTHRALSLPEGPVRTELLDAIELMVRSMSQAGTSRVLARLESLYSRLANLASEAIVGQNQTVENRKLTSENKTLKIENSGLKDQVSALRGEIQGLIGRVEKLETNRSDPTTIGEFAAQPETEQRPSA